MARDCKIGSSGLLTVDDHAVGERPFARPESGSDHRHVLIDISGHFQVNLASPSQTDRMDRVGRRRPTETDRP